MIGSDWDWRVTVRRRPSVYQRSSFDGDSLSVCRFIVPNTVVPPVLIEVVAHTFCIMRLLHPTFCEFNTPSGKIESQSEPAQQYDAR